MTTEPQLQPAPSMDGPTTPPPTVTVDVDDRPFYGFSVTVNLQITSDALLETDFFDPQCPADVADAVAAVVGAGHDHIKECITKRLTECHRPNDLFVELYVPTVNAISIDSTDDRATFDAEQTIIRKGLERNPGVPGWDGYQQRRQGGAVMETLTGRPIAIASVEGGGHDLTIRFEGDSDELRKAVVRMFKAEAVVVYDPY